MVSLVLLPGMDGTGVLFQPFITSLGTGVNARTIRYPNEKQLDHAELASFARSTLPSGMPVVLVGESFSGPVAVLLAAESGWDVRAVVLCASFVRNPRPWMTKVVARLPITISAASVAAPVLLGRFSNAGLRSLFAAALAQISI